MRARVVSRGAWRHVVVMVLAISLTGWSGVQADEVVVDPATTWRASVPNGGIGEPNGTSDGAVVSADGRYVAFTSSASNLVDDDTNGGRDIFVHDRDTHETIRVSVATGGAQVHGTDWGSYYPSISWDGRRVSFTSDAPDVVPDGFGAQAIYVHDLDTRETQLVSVATDGGFGTGYTSMISGDGRHVAFESGSELVPDDTNGRDDIYVRDLEAGTTTRVSVASDGMEGNGEVVSGPPSISYNGRYVAFSSFASNLVAGDTNDEADVFVHDRLTGVTERVSIGTDGQEGDSQSGGVQAISGDGRIVAFNSWATTFDDNDANDHADVYVRDRLAGTTTLVSVNSDGEQANGLGGLDLDTGKHALSGDGRYVAMRSAATNLAPGGNGVLSEVFVHDRVTGETWRASVSSAGTPSVYGRGGAISADGWHVAFRVMVPTMIWGGPNPYGGVFVRSRGQGICAPPVAECMLDR